jgi:hypothetical protein
VALPFAKGEQRRGNGRARPLGREVLTRQDKRRIEQLDAEPAADAPVSLAATSVSMC